MKQYIVLIDGVPRETNTDCGVRVYKTRAHAEKESQFLLKYRKGSKIEIGELSAINIQELLAEEGD